MLANIKSRRKEWLLAGLLCALGALVATWPLALHFGAALPLGSESTGTVPFFNVWTLEWNVHSLLQGYRGYWDAPIFYPATDAFAFSDPQPLTGCLALPFHGLGRAVAYNGVLLIFLWLNGVCGYGLLRGMGAGRPAALAGGVAMQWLPFFSHERGVLQLQALFPMLLAWLACVKLEAGAGRLWAAALGFSLAATFYTSQYYAIIAVVVLLPWFLSLVFSGRRKATSLALAAAITAACVLPVAVRQSGILSGYGFHRSLESVTNSSALWTDYLVPSQTNWLGGWLARQPARTGLYPGLLLTALGLAGAALRRDRLAGKLLASGFIAFLLSFGTRLNLLGWHPYEWLWTWVPGFQHLRSPFRFGLWAQVCLVVLAVFALEAAWKPRRKWLAPVLVILLLVELLPAPDRLVPLPPAHSFTAVDPPVIFLPFVEGSSAAAYERTTLWMLDAETSGLAIANGYSGYFPDTNLQLKQGLADFPDEEGLELLGDLGIRSLIVPAEWRQDERYRLLDTWLQEGRLELASQQQGAVILQLP